MNRCSLGWHKWELVWSGTWAEWTNRQRDTWEANPQGPPPPRQYPPPDTLYGGSVVGVVFERCNRCDELRRRLITEPWKVGNQRRLKEDLGKLGYDADQYPHRDTNRDAS
jgi:hypothetical protein